VRKNWTRNICPQRPITVPSLVQEHSQLFDQQISQLLEPEMSQMSEQQIDQLFREKMLQAAEPMVGLFIKMSQMVRQVSEMFQEQVSLLFFQGMIQMLEQKRNDLDKALSELASLKQSTT
jgi:hypothetical protein